MAFSRDFATRGEAAIRLNLSPRQIDRLCAAGRLRKVKSSDNRAGILRESLDLYIELAKSGWNASGKNQDTDAENQDTYGTAMKLIIVELDEPHPEVGRLVDQYLVANGLPGILVDAYGSQLHIAWAWSLPYEPSDIRARIRALEAAGTTPAE